MNNVSDYHTIRTREYYQNLHMSYRFGDTLRGMNGPIFSREFCGGANGNGPAFQQNMSTRATKVTPLTITRPVSTPFAPPRTPVSFASDDGKISARTRMQFQLTSAFPGGPRRISSSGARYL